MSKNAPANKTQAPRYYVLGAGAMGMLWGTRLNQAGAHTAFITRAVKNTVPVTEYSASKRLSETTTFNAYSASDLSHEELAGATVIIATKAHQATQALTEILPALHNSSNILALCNGIGMQQAMLELLNKNNLTSNLFWGVSSDGALIDTQQSLRHTGAGTTRIGCLSNTHNASPKAPLPKYLTLNIEYVNDIKTAIWQKFFINCAINPVTVLFECNNGELINNKNYAEFFCDLCSELQLLYDELQREFAGQSPALSPDSMQCILPTNFSVLDAATQIAQRTANNVSSMLRDTRSKKNTEINALNAYLVKWAKRRQLPCSLNQQLVENVLQLAIHS